jgi:hypothetical protein
MAQDTTPFLERLKQGLEKWLATAIITTIGLTGLALLRVWGDKAFDAVVLVLGKRLFLQLILVLFCILSYFAWTAFFRRHQKLHRRRALYWGRGDSTPYCPYCYERHSRKVHLTGPIPLLNSAVERWDCSVCSKVYCADNSGVGFLIHSNIHPR